LAGPLGLFFAVKNRPILFTHQSTFSPTPPPIETFIENKDQPGIRPDGDRAVEAIFLGYFDYQSRSIFGLSFVRNLPTN
jgi:hypothetical protein